MNQPQSSSTATAGSANSFISQAQQWLKQGNMSELLGQVPTSLKKVGNQTATSFNKLTTTQKVVGGAALLVGATLLARRNKAGRAGKSATLNELLYFVNDRIEGYKRAVAESQDTQLRGYYQQLLAATRRPFLALTSTARSGPSKPTKKL
jgi:uncharacterized lipoprotein YddW (UPF0748 family)